MEKTDTNNQMQSLTVYSKDVIEGQYPNGLAYSVHISIQGESVRNGYGMLFPKGSVDENNRIVPAYAGTIRVAAVCIDQKAAYLITGEDWTEKGCAKDKQNSFWAWLTEDFISYEEWNLCDASVLEARTGLSVAELRRDDTVSISYEFAERIKEYWNEKPEKNTKYPKLQFPFSRGFGDPVFFLWKDDYYYIATNDNVGDIGFYVRKAHEPENLFAEDTKVHIILDRDEKRGLIQTFWAPEFHVINGALYLIFAVSNENWGPQCHIMKLKENGDILNSDDWEDPKKVTRPQGKKLGENGITLDMTYVKSGERHYYVWSYREKIGSPMDSGSMLMVAEFNPENPYELITEPVCLSRPLYGFENTNGTINNEGPYAFYHGNKIYLAYSGGDARGYLYTVGMLTAEDGADLCDLSVWEKAKTPILSFKSVPGEYGPGHNSFFCDRDGDWWIAYHGVTSFEERIISDGIRKIRYDSEGCPKFV